MSKQLELDESPLLRDFLPQDYKTLVPSQYEVLDCKLTYEEISTALQGMSNKKPLAWMASLQNFTNVHGTLLASLFTNP